MYYRVTWQCGIQQYHGNHSDYHSNSNKVSYCKQIVHQSAFVVNGIKIFFHLVLITMQNLVVLSHTVCM